MILTTNRMRSIDTAFESRIDITLTYNSLTEADRKQVWRNFIQNLDPNDVDIDEQAIDRLAQWDFNGRQIKSAIKTARILAAKKKMPLNVDHLNVVLNMREKALRLSRGDEGENGDEPLAKRIKVNGS
jgi:SpoVK/Ycf46/Vps4 family AAA+-type ATPase